MDKEPSPGFQKAGNICVDCRCYVDDDHAQATGHAVGFAEVPANAWREGDTWVIPLTGAE